MLNNVDHRYARVISVKAPEEVIKAIKDGRNYISTNRKVKFVVGDKVCLEAVDEFGIKTGYKLTRRVSAIDKDKPWIATGYTILSVR